MNQDKIIENFIEKIRHKGFLSGKIEPDDRIYRCRVEGDGKRESSASIRLLIKGPFIMGWFRNHRTGESVPLSESLSGDITNIQRKEILSELKNLHIQEKSEAEARAKQIWQSAALTGNNAYLERKRIQNFSCRFQGGALIVPVTKDGKNIVSLQFILPDGEKRFLKGGEKRGNFCLIGNRPPVGGRAILCEGYATGVTLHMATGLPVIVAFDSGNLAPAIRQAQSLWPTTIWLIAADNDKNNEDKNPGLEGAQKALIEVRRMGGSGAVSSPEFPAVAAATALSDWNDMHVHYGLDAVRMALNV